MAEETRLGLIVPSSNTAAERDFRALMPRGVEVHTARMYLAETTAEQERIMLDRHAPQAAADLGTLHPHVVVFSCTSAGALLGVDGEDHLVEELGRLAGADLVSTNAAVAWWLGRRGAGRVAVVTAYVDELNRAIESSLRARGVDVARIAGLGMTDNYAIAEVATEQIVDLVKQVVDGDVGGDIEGVFISCTNLRAVPAADELASLLGVPVVSSNLAAADLALERIGLPVSGHGLP